jgi:hypothetical protein
LDGYWFFGIDDQKMEKTRTEIKDPLRRSRFGGFGRVVNQVSTSDIAS